MNLNKYRKVVIFEREIRHEFHNVKKMEVADLALKRVNHNTFEVVKDRFGQPFREVVLSDSQQAKILLENSIIGV